MKVAVIADPHANFAALQAVAAHIDAWKPDQVVVAGDLVNRGPRPRECLEFVLDRVQRQGWRLVRGNHEDYVIEQALPQAEINGPTSEVHRASFWTFEQLGYDVTALQAMPFEQSLFDPAGRELRFVHASMKSIREGIYPETSTEGIKSRLRWGATPAAVFCVGHTHRPLVREIDGTLVVNAGSSGLPFDGDSRPAYAQLTLVEGHWIARIIRVNYDWEQAERDFRLSGYLEGGGPLVRVVLVELRTASSQLYYWADRFQEPALAGHISMEESVRRYLGD